MIEGAGHPGKSWWCRGRRHRSSTCATGHPPSTMVSGRRNRLVPSTGIPYERPIVGAANPERASMSHRSRQEPSTGSAHGSLCRGVAVLVLMIQLAPTASTTLAGLGHGTFHLLERTREALDRSRRSWAARHRRAHAGPEGHPRPHQHGSEGERHAHAAPPPRRSADPPATTGASHVHGPTDRGHTHGSAVDALLSTVSDRDDDLVGPVPPGIRGIDEHVPPPLVFAPDSAGQRLAAVPRSGPLLPADPPAPPLRPPRA